MIFFAAMLHVVAGALSLLIGFFFLIMTFGHEIQRKLHDLTENYKIERKKANMINGLGRIIQIHSEIKELSYSFSLLMLMSERQRIAV